MCQGNSSENFPNDIIIIGSKESRISLFPAKAEKLMQWLNQYLFPIFQYFCWYAIFAEGLPRSMSINGFTKLLHDSQVWNGIEGRVCDYVLFCVQLEVVF